MPDQVGHDKYNAVSFPSNSKIDIFIALSNEKINGKKRRNFGHNPKPIPSPFISDRIG